MPVSFSKLSAVARWLKDHPVITLITILGSILGYIKGVPPAWNAATQIAGIPECLTYGNVYHHSQGRFENNGMKWTEYGDWKDIDIIKFEEIHRDRNYIILRNLTARAGPKTNSNLIVRIPVCGGTVQWSIPNPQQWTDLYTVWR